MLRLLVLLVAALPCSATWALVQHTHISTCAAGTTCALTVTSTGGGHLLVALANLGSGGGSLSSVSGGGTYVHCTNCSVGTWDASYALNSTSGTTSVTFTASVAQSVNWQVELLEYSSTATPIALDTSGSRNQTTTVNPVGVTLTLTGSNDVIIQAVTSSSGVTAISSPYIADFFNGNGVAWALNTASGTGPTWTATSSGALLTGIAFKETATATNAIPMVVLLETEHNKITSSTYSRKENGI